MQLPLNLLFSGQEGLFTRFPDLRLCHLGDGSSKSWLVEEHKGIVHVHCLVVFKTIVSVKLSAELREGNRLAYHSEIFESALLRLLQGQNHSSGVPQVHDKVNVDRFRRLHLC